MLRYKSNIYLYGYVDVYIFMCECVDVLGASVCMQEPQKPVDGNRYLELELQATELTDVGAGKEAWVLWKSIKCSF